MRTLVIVAGAAATAFVAGWEAAAVAAFVVVLPLGGDRRVAGACTAAAGAVHLAVAPEHFVEWWGFGLFFVACGQLQLMWALGRRRGAPRGVHVGLAGNAAVVLLWLASRTTGLPVGPDPWRPEPAAAADLAAVALELTAIVALAVNRRAGTGECPRSVATTREEITSMLHPRRIVTALAALVLTGVLVTGALASESGPSMSRSQRTASVTAADLRVELDQLLGEHAALAMNATNAGYSGSKAFPAIAKQLDENSVALSKAIASIYGMKAGSEFLNGKDMWRDHIRFFVDYTVALARKDRAGEAKAVAGLKAYTVTFGNFLAGATGLPTLAVRNDLLGHVYELKDQLDAYAAGHYAQAQALYDAAYKHMFMTGNTLAAAIAKQKNLH